MSSSPGPEPLRPGPVCAPVSDDSAPKTTALQCVCSDVMMAAPVHARLCDADEESSGSKQKFCPYSIFSMSAGVGRGVLGCEDDRSLLSQRLWSVILMCSVLNGAPTHPTTHFWHFHKAGDISMGDVALAEIPPAFDLELMCVRPL